MYIHKIKYETLKARFLRHAGKRPRRGCWIWQSAKDGAGYGVFGWRYRRYLAHRVAWLIYRGEIPAGLWVLHTCDVRSCVNPAHLWLGTIADNSRDMKEKGRARNGGPHWLVTYMRAHGREHWEKHLKGKRKRDAQGRFV